MSPHLHEIIKETEFKPAVTVRDWEDAFFLYQESYRKQKLLEQPWLNFQEFKRRYVENAFLFVSLGRVGGMGLVFKEGNGVVLKNLYLQEKCATSNEEMLASLKSFFRSSSRLQILISDREADLHGALKNAGFVYRIKKNRMIVPLATLVSQLSASALPEGYQVENYRPGQDRSRFAGIMNAAFCHLWNHQDITSETVKMWELDSHFDSRGYLFLTHRQDTIGFLASSADPDLHYKTGKDNVGILHEIGILPSFRKRGLAPAFLASLIPWLKSKEIEYLFLSVGDNNDSARAFYNRAGFQVSYAMDTWEYVCH